jgi:outer membrane biosynthesis protein TonB
VSEPDWVYRQRRQRAAVLAAMVVGAITMVVVLASTLSGGFSVDLGGRNGKPIAMPDPDVVLAREKRQIDAQKQRKIERRQQREQARRDPRRPKPDKKPTTSPAPVPAATPQRSAPAPAPTPASTPDPATAPAPAAPQPSPQPASGGGVDPRFY